MTEIIKITGSRPNIPTRVQQITALKNSDNEFDILIIGGGATGSGACLEAATRGLKVACIEAGDFCSQTSGKSTKLIHGGVRYLEQGFRHLNPIYLKLVFEALRERRIFMNMAPHLTNELRIATPVYDHAWKVPYLYIGLKLYDMISGLAGISDGVSRRLGPTNYLSIAKTIELFPHLQKKGLKGAVLYSDGEFNDTRMGVSLQVTAATHGAVIANYIKATSFIKNEAGKIIGARVTDKLTDVTWDINAKAVINATGPQVDLIRLLDDPLSTSIIVPSVGSHIAINKSIHHEIGFLLPEAPAYNNQKLGTVAFIKPFENTTIVGTTDVQKSLSPNPTPTEDEIFYLLNAYNSIVDEESKAGRKDVTSAWSGFRPLVLRADAKSSKDISRNHEIIKSSSGLITIAGGKWTTFREMGEQVVAFAIANAKLKPKNASQTTKIKIIGSDGFNRSLAAEITKQYGIADDVAHHLCNNYGTQAVRVLELANQHNLHEKISPRHPYILAEVAYSTLYEYAQNVEDILYRRISLGFVDEEEATRVKDQVNLTMKQFKT